MRNIAQHPVTPDEVLDVLKEMQALAVEKAPFSTFGYVLYLIQQWLIDHPDQLNEIVESGKV